MARSMSHTRVLLIVNGAQGHAGAAVGTAVFSKHANKLMFSRDNVLDVLVGCVNVDKCAN